MKQITRASAQKSKANGHGESVETANKKMKPSSEKKVFSEMTTDMLAGQASKETKLIPSEHIVPQNNVTDPDVSSQASSSDVNRSLVFSGAAIV